MTLRSSLSLLAPSIATSALLVPLLATPASAQRVSVTFENERVSLQASDARPSDVFDQLGDKTGVRFLIDSELEPGALNLAFEDFELERAVRSIVNAIPEVGGHTMSFARAPEGGARLAEVMVFAAGKSGPGSDPRVYGGSSRSGPAFAFPTPDLEERLEKMVEAGIPPETAEKVVDLTREVQRLQATPEPGSYSVRDLSPEARDQLDTLLDRGVSEERAVQMLLLQERYQSTLQELSDVAGTLRAPTPTPPPE